MSFSSVVTTSAPISFNQDPAASQSGLQEGDGVRSATDENGVGSISILGGYICVQAPYTSHLSLMTLMVFKPFALAN